MLSIRFIILSIVALLWTATAFGEPSKEKVDAFWKALRNGHAATIDTMLKDSPDLADIRKSDKSSPLHLAARSGLLEVAKKLIANKAPVNAESKPGVTPLIEAIRRQHTDMCKLLFDAGADPNIKGDFGTALHVAVMTKKINTVKLLLENKAKVDSKDKRDNTPLSVAVDYKSFEIARLLIKNKADVNIANKQGFTPLLKLLGGKDPDIEMLKLFLENGANVNVQTGYEKKSPLHYATMWGNVDAAKLLLDYGADRKLVNNMKKTAAELAQKQDLKKLIETYKPIPKGAAKGEAKTLKGLVAHFIANNIPGDIVEYESDAELTRLGIVENVTFLGEKDGKEYNFSVIQFKDKASLKKALPLLKGRGGIMQKNGLFVISLQSKGPASEIVKIFKQY